MTTYFVTHKDAAGGNTSRMFNTVEKLFEWLGHYCDDHGGYPPSLTVFKAECIFDGS